MSENFMIQEMEKKFGYLSTDTTQQTGLESLLRVITRDVTSVYVWRVSEACLAKILSVTLFLNGKFSRLGEGLLTPHTLLNFRPELHHKFSMPI